MRNLLTFALKVAISGILLYFAFAHVNFELVGRQLHHLQYFWLTTAILILVAQVGLIALRWQKIVEACNEPGAPPFTILKSLRYMFVAAFFNQTLPSSVGGDAVRIWMLARDNGGWKSATYSVLIDRMVGVLVLALLVIVCLPWSFALIGNVAGRIALLARRVRQHRSLLCISGPGLCALAMAGPLVADAPVGRGRLDRAPRVRRGIKPDKHCCVFGDHPSHDGDRGVVAGESGGRAA